MPRPRLEIRSTDDELRAWREAAKDDHIDDLATWVRRVLWREVEKLRRRKK